MTKRILIIVTLIVSSITSIQSQEIAKNAIGLRIGDNDGFGAEISYQRGLSDNNRLELDLGWRDWDSATAIKLAGIYQWVFNLDKGLNWYVGPGGGVGFVDYNNDFPGDNSSDSYFFIGGDIGIEYDFDIPLLLSIDVRPEIGFGDFNDDLDLDIALGIRYQF